MSNSRSVDSVVSKRTSSFGLSKDVHAPIMVKICYMTNTGLIPQQQQLIKLSDKYENARVFNTLSNIYKNSDLYVEVSIYDGSNNLLTNPVQTCYKSFNNNKREWNQYLKFSINYNQIVIDSYLKFVLYEIVETKPKQFGISYLSLFNKKNSTLRKGSQKIPIYRNPNDEKIQYEDMSGLTELESLLIKHENGEFQRVGWLDKQVLPNLSKLNEQNTDYEYYLYVELAPFDLPIVYSDISYQTLNYNHTTKNSTIIENINSNVILNSIDIPNAMKVYDPDYQFAKFSENLNQNPTVEIETDPIESKYHKLERKINNPILDKELKPSPQVRDELIKILLKPSHIELSDIEKNSIWKFRYYFSKNNATNDPSDKIGSAKSFLPKFLKSIDWDTDNELDHAFKEIIPIYWSVDKLQMGDALDLLSNYFNPFILGEKALSFGNDNKISSNKKEETKFQKIFKYITIIRSMAVERLKLASSDELLLYLLQLVQTLKYEADIFERDIPGLNDELNGNGNSNGNHSSIRSPLARFLIERSVESEKLGNYFYWYVKVENEDHINNTPQQLSNSPSEKVYSTVMDIYIKQLKEYSKEKSLPYYDNLRKQINFIKKLTNLVQEIRSPTRKIDTTAKKVEFLREFLSTPSNNFLKFDPFPLPLDPSIIICGCYPKESSVFKSSLSPLKITFKTVRNKNHSQIFGKKSSKHGKYPLMFKIGDDLRQDQFVIQIINLMDQLLKNENLDLKLTPYKILATSPIAGLIQFVENETLDKILSNMYPALVVYEEGTIPPSITAASASLSNVLVASNNGILSYLRLHSQEKQQVEPDAGSVLTSSYSSDQRSSQSQSRSQPQPQPAVSSGLGVSDIVMENYVKSCAAYCVITYILGVGDRHLDNLLISPNGKFWHADFGYMFGRDPKPFPPVMKLPIQVIDGMGGMNHENYNIFKSYCFITYNILRKNSNLILNLFQLMVDANIPDISTDPQRVIENVQDKFCLEMSDEGAMLHFQDLINNNVGAFYQNIIDRLHSLAQYWRA
ncbi:1-phosphatidylinositol 3-kinase [Scheffersomyces amazonensis]|uniref:1-phosphatidylinositol 3-kinase n=1 Tax=Scheffersomyces amazonensis TaxID=1078765 RepID=UPI00315CCBEB